MASEKSNSMISAVVSSGEDSVSAIAMPVSLEVSLPTRQARGTYRIRRNAQPMLSKNFLIGVKPVIKPPPSRYMGNFLPC